MGLLAYGELTIADINDGVSVVSVDVWYIQTSSPTEAPNKNDANWKTEAPDWTNGKYIWSKTVTIFDNGESNESDPVCITGNTGAAGSGIVSITEEYYMSDSKTIAPNENDSGWTTTPPTWEDGKYIWTRSKIVWSNPTATTYTTPVCDSSWEAINDAKEDFDEQIKVINTTISSVNARVDAVEKEIELKVEYTDITSAINEYDKTVSEGLRTRVSQIEIDVDGITSEVSDTQTLVEKVNSKIDNLQQTGVAWKVNYSNFTTKANGQLYLHGYNAETGDAADIDGWVSWNGIQVIVPKATINPGNVCPSNTPIYVVHRAAGTTYLVWADSEGIWRHSNLSPASILGEWEWNHSTDIILGSFYHAGNGNAIESAQIYASAASCDSIITSVETKSLIDQTSGSILLQVKETYATTEDLEKTNDNVASLEITATDIKSEVFDDNGNSKIEQNANAISSKVWTEDISSAITQSNNEINASITNIEGDITNLKLADQRFETTIYDAEGKSKIEQNAEAINLRVTNDEMEAAIKEKADEINITVSKKMEKTEIRYIRDWLQGGVIYTSADNPTPFYSNDWVQCKVMVDEVDIALGIIPALYDSNHNLITGVSNLDTYTDGVGITLLEDVILNVDEVVIDGETTEEDEESIEIKIENVNPSSYISTNFNGTSYVSQYLLLDLGVIRTDIEMIVIHHLYVDERMYNHKIEVSADGETWITLGDYRNILISTDTYQDNRYAETTDGKTYYFSSNGLLTDMFSSINQSVNELNLQVNDLNKRAGTFVTSDSVTTIVQGVTETIPDEVKNQLNSLDSETMGILSENIAKTEVLINKIKNTVSEMNITDGYAKSSEVLQTADEWKIRFARLQMYEPSESDDKAIRDAYAGTYVSITEQGLTVGNDTSQLKTVLTPTALTGYQNIGTIDDPEFDPVFILQEDLTTTRRIKVDNGIDTSTIKIIPKKYNEGTASEYGALAFVKTGGSS